MLVGIQPLASGFYANQAGVFQGDVGVEDAHGVAATAHAGDHGIGLFTRQLQAAQQLGHLRQALFANYALKVAHHGWVGGRARHGADDVEGVVHIRHPVAHGFVERVFQGFAA